MTSNPLVMCVCVCVCTCVGGGGGGGHHFFPSLVELTPYYNLHAIHLYYISGLKSVLYLDV